MRNRAIATAALLLLTNPPLSLGAQQPSVETRLQGFDGYMETILKDWNVPGIGVGVVVKDRLVFAKGYGYRDYGRDTSLMYDFHKVRLPLSHFHYDRFDTPDDEREGKSSVNCLTNPQGEIDRAEMSLDESAVAFTRRVPATLASAATLRQYLGSYETASGNRFDVVLRTDGTLAIQFANGSFQNLNPWQPHRFRIKEFPDVIFEFVVANGRATALKQSDPSGEFTFVRKGQ